MVTLTPLQSNSGTLCLTIFFITERQSQCNTVDLTRLIPHFNHTGTLLGLVLHGTTQ